MSAAFISHLQTQIEATKQDGLYKKERVITSQQQALTTRPSFNVNSRRKYCWP